MFDSNIRNCLPGYTGHIPGRIDEDSNPQQSGARKQIPGKSHQLDLSRRLRGLYPRSEERECVWTDLRQGHLLVQCGALPQRH